MQSVDEWDLIWRIGLALALSASIGLDRELKQKSAGLRTYTLVGIGSALFMLISKYGFFDVLKENEVVLDPSRVAAQIVSGIGFIGAGVVFHNENSFVRGITTASAIFATAAIGVVVGTGRLVVGSVTAIGVLLVLELRNIPVLRRLDARRYEARFRDDNEPPSALRTRS